MGKTTLVEILWNIETYRMHFGTQIMCVKEKKTKEAAIVYIHTTQLKKQYAN